MTHLTHFYLLLLGIGYGVNDHSDSERKPSATTTRATLFLLAINALSYAQSHSRIGHTMAFDP